jgi:glucose/arabinose dehydrogenase
VHHRLVIPALISLAWCSLALAQNTPPNTPTILEPAADRPLNPSDVHMETAPFSDPNPGQTLASSDFEIWDLTLNEPVWRAEGLTGAIAIHAHLGDGQFVNSLNDRRQLNPETDYRFRVRHRDNSGDPFTEWSAWAERDFTTGTLGAVYAMELHDIQQGPVPTVRTPQGAPFSLPTSTNQPRIRVTAACCGALLLEIRASGQGNKLTNPPPLSMHMPLKIEVSSGSMPLSLPELDVAFVGGNGKRLKILLPAISLIESQSIAFWVAAEGSTYSILPEHTGPTFDSVARRNLAPWLTSDDFSVSVFATGFQLPVNIAFLNNPGPNPTDPLFYVSELYGDIQLVRRNGTVTPWATGLLNFDPFGGFPGSGEGGLAGLAVEPATGNVFVSMLHNFSSNPADISGRVVRIRALSGGALAGSQTTILDLAPAQLAPSHQISALAFDPDGNLLVHVGDGFDIEAPLNLDDVRGKILRVLPTGLPLPTNPFYNATDGITARDYIYTYGHRNPFGGEFRPADNQYFMVENGPGRDRLALVLSGRNFGYNGTDESMGIFASYVWDPSIAPVDIAFLDEARFANSGFPIEYASRAFVTQSGGTWATGPGTGEEKRITEFVLDANGNRLRGPRPVATYAGSGKASCSAIAAGPGGLYFADLYKDDSFENPIARGSQILLLSYEAPPDCNVNSIADVLETLQGTTADCNWNLVPDSCDIANQISADCDADSIPDECTTTSLETTNFDDGPGPFSINGGAIRAVDGANGFIRLDTTIDTDEGAIVREPLRSTPLSRLQGRFDFRMGGLTQDNGLSFTIFEASRPSTIFFGEDGVQNAPLTVRFQNDSSDPEGPGVIDLLRNGQRFARTTLGYNLADGQWRTARMSLGPEGFTLVLITNGISVPIFVGEVVDGFEPLVAKLGFGAETKSASAFYELDNIAFALPNALDLDQDYTPDACSIDCDSIDFNNDASVFDPTDIDAFFSVFSEGPCIPESATCNDIDFNNDGSFFDPDDVDAFLRVFSEGPCRP